MIGLRVELKYPSHVMNIETWRKENSNIKSIIILVKLLRGLCCVSFMRRFSNIFGKIFENYLAPEVVFIYPEPSIKIP